MNRLRASLFALALGLSPAYADLYIPPGGSGGGGGTTTINGVACALNGSCTVGVALANITGAGLNVLTTLAAAVNATGGVVSPTPVRAGDVIYWNGSSWTTLSGNNSGTQFLSENGSGVPAWSSVVSGVSSVSTTCPAAGPSTGAVTISNGVGVTAKATAYNVALADCGTFFEVTGTTTLTLPGFSGGGAVAGGFGVSVFNGGANTVTVTASSGNINANGTSGASITLTPGQSTALVVNAAVNGWDGATSYRLQNIVNVPFSASPFTYTPSSGIVSADVYCAGGGGGGGSGAVLTSGTAGSGGGSGGAAMGVYARFTAAQLGASVTVTIGAGGAGGAAPATGTQVAGNNGSGGNPTTFGSLLKAWGGGAGSGGGIATASAGGGSAGWFGPGGNASAATPGTAGAGGGVAGNAGAGTANASYGLGSGGAGSSATGAVGNANGGGWLFTSGGAGGGISTTPTAFNGGAVSPPNAASFLGNVSGGTTVSPNGNPGTAATFNLTPGGFLGGTGASGGASSITTTLAGGNGGLGALGNGGGGGGAILTTNTVAAGAGGAGGNGQCAIVENF